MAVMTFRLQVEMEDAKTYDVVADQRDLAAWECQPFGTSGNALDGRMHLALRFLAWNALRRNKLTALSWDEFNDQCVEVRDAPMEDVESPLDPGPKAPSAES